NTIVVTPALARKYFGDADPVGKTLRIDNRVDFEVTGVVEEAPGNSHFHYTILASWATLDALGVFDYETRWGNNSIYTYLLLPEGTDPGVIEAQFPAFIERHAGRNWNGSKLSLQAL